MDQEDRACYEEDQRSLWGRSIDSGVASSSFSRSKSMSTISVSSLISDSISITTDSDSFYRTPGAFKRRCPPSKTERDLIMLLPDDCLLRVANELSLHDLINMMSCCRRFHSVGSASSSWKVIDFGDRSVPGDVIRRIIMRGTTVLRLCGTNIVDPIPDIGEEPFYTKLTHVDATRLSFTPQSQLMLSNILISSTILTHISLSGCDITLEIATHLSRIHSLSHLDLSMCDNLTPDHLSLILYRCGRTVMELNVSCSKIGREGGMVIATRCSSNLLRLDLSGSAPSDNPDDSIDDAVVATLVKNCPSLWEVHLSDSPNLTDVSFENLMRLPDLESVSFSRCYGIDPHKYLLPNQLTNLCVYGLLSEEGVQHVRNNLPSTRVNDLDLAISHVARPTPPPHITALWGIKMKPFCQVN